MAKKVLSIIIGTEFTKVCEVSYHKNYKSNKGIRVYKSMTFPNPENSIEDGYIKDMGVFGTELRNQLKAGKFKTDKAIFSISSSKIANREIILPPTKEKKIMDIITTGASDYFPIDIKDYVISYVVYEKNTTNKKEKQNRKEQKKAEAILAKQQAKQAKKKSKTEIIAEKMESMEANVADQSSPNSDNDNNNIKVDSAKKHMRLGVYAVPSTLVKNYYHFAKLMHLDIVSLDYSGNSSYQILKRQVNQGTSVFVQINEKDTLISILKEDTLLLQRTVGYGVSMLSDAVLEVGMKGIDNKSKAIELLEKKNLLTSEADRQTLGQSENNWAWGEVAATREPQDEMDASLLMSRRREQEAKRYIIDSLHFLTNSIARMLDYYKNSHNNMAINEIYILGTGVHIQGIDQFFSSEIGIASKKLDKLVTVTSKKKVANFRKNPSEYLSCIGAVINPIDFIPREFLEKKQRRSAIIATIFFTIACIAGSAGVVYISYTDYLAAKQELDEVKQQYASLPQVNAVEEEHSKAENELNNLKEFEASSTSMNDDIKAIIDELENKLPTGAKVNTLQFSETGVVMSITASGSDSNALIAKLYVQMEAIKYFSSVEITDIQVGGDVELPTVSFNISCTYAK